MIRSSGLLVRGLLDELTAAVVKAVFHVLEECGYRLLIFRRPWHQIQMAIDCRQNRLAAGSLGRTASLNGTNNSHSSEFLANSR
jgi:hypothetical protein